MTEHVPHTPTSSVRTYVAMFGLLLMLTGITAAVAFVDLGRLSTVVMLVIAATKATLVVLFFMHVRHGPGLTKLVAVAGFAWLALMIAFTMADVVTRGPQVP